MTVILIADAGKASLVMSSEVFKDKIPGSSILVARNGQEMLEVAERANPDMCLVDFDLPDVDGVTLIEALRKRYKGPILLTAYPDNIVSEAVDKHLFAFNDASSWLAKPVKVESLSEKIDRFLLERRRVGRRFETEMPTQVVGKGAGRGKRAPKVSAKLINLSLEGACIRLDAPMKMALSDELTVSINLPDGEEQAAPKVKTAKRPKGATAAKKVDDEASESRIRARVAWMSEGGRLAGLQFGKLSDAQRRGLETLLRDCAK